MADHQPIGRGSEREGRDAVGLLARGLPGCELPVGAGIPYSHGAVLLGGRQARAVLTEGGEDVLRWGGAQLAGFLLAGSEGEGPDFAVAEDGDQALAVRADGGGCNRGTKVFQLRPGEGEQRLARAP